MTAVQKIVYDSLRAFGYAWKADDASDGSVFLIDRKTQHTLCLYPNAHLYEIAGGKYRSVTFH
jgi:hypothetical protein